MVKIPVYFDQPVKVQDAIENAQGELIWKYTPVDTSGGSAIWTVPGFGDTGYLYKLRCVHYNLVTAENSYIAVELKDPNMAGGLAPGLGGINQLYYTRRVFRVGGAIGDFTEGGPGTFTDVLMVYFQDHLPSFWFGSNIRPYIGLGADSGGWVTVLFEKVRTHGM